MPLIGFADSVEPVDVGNATDVINIINRAGSWIFGIVISVAVIFFVLAGFYFVSAQGDPEKINKAKQMIIYTTIGVVVALIAKAVPYFIYTVLKP